MSDAAVSIDRLGKRYAIGGPWREKQVREILSRPFEYIRGMREKRQTLWALRDVSFDIPSGEVVGVIGRNGAGKSTLLKILSRITEPTEGEARIYGRVASLLEVGTGFHPELTGRENVFLNGSILGMPRADIRKRFDEIVAFADVGRLLDTPVKRYSSGMFVRLAFAVAAHVDPEILLVDEVLAVGDAAFQKKCLGRMTSLSQEGRTVIVVSHNMSVVSSICERVAWLRSGNLADYGPTRHIVGRYLSDGIEVQNAWSPSSQPADGFRLHKVQIVSDEDRSAFPADEPITLRFDYTVDHPIPPSRLGFLVRNEEGINVLESHSSDTSPTLNQQWETGSGSLSCTIPGGLLRPGRYFVTIAEPYDRTPIVHESVLEFTVSEQNSIVARDGRSALFAPVLRWDRERIQ